ncbi:DnaD domain protein [Limosilactobacillus vaginalis]|uniref:DnaD domain protein n=1 Tax=Limosilactobacillus vaginalis TaxID=1633 RepID=UPI0024BA30FA|nr:DnaD domain protein [Limosilactobacillus vaginalis]
MEHPSYYSILTANVRYDPRLKNHADCKVLYSEITALSNKYGYCHATNKYFAKLYDRPVPTISKWINLLKDCGYLKVVMIKDGKQIKERRIYPVSTPINVDVNTYLGKREEGINGNVKSPINVDVKENITSINNTSKNNMLNDARHTFRDVHNLWESNWGFPNGIAEQDLTEWTKKYGADLVMHVITYALRRNINSKGADRYLARTFEQYDKQSIKTVEQAERSEKQHEQQMSREYQSMGGRRRPVHVDPVKKDYTPPKGFDR